MLYCTAFFWSATAATTYKKLSLDLYHPDLISSPSSLSLSVSLSLSMVRYLKYALESVDGVGRVSVDMKALGSDGLPSVCVPTQLASTTITLTDQIGSIGPMGLTTKTSNTRLWRNGGIALNLTDSTPTLQMATQYFLVCPVLCPSCDENAVLFFKYGRSLSVPVNITGSTHSLIISSILALTDLKNSQWPNLNVTVTATGGSSSICDSSRLVSVTTTITLTSTYGNIAALDIISSPTSSLTLTSTAGYGTLYECSNQGVCDSNTGACVCNSLISDGELQYQAVSTAVRAPIMCVAIIRMFQISVLDYSVLLITHTVTFTLYIL